jgi:ParB-like nuclease domain
MYEQHPLSGAFPPMQESEFTDLMDSIEKIGVQEPITIYEGMILDGWHRYRAANILIIDCPMVELGDVDPQEFVIAKNKARRNLTASQRAIAVTTVYEWHSTGRSKEVDTSVHLPKTNVELAKIAGVGVTTIKLAKVAQNAGFTDAVKIGEVSVKAAAKQVTGAVATPRTKPEVAPVIDVTPDYTELDAAHDKIEDLQAELAVASMGGASADDKFQASNLIEDLRSEVKTLKATLNAVKTSRDILQNENAELKKQVNMQRRELEKFNGKKT